MLTLGFLFIGPAPFFPDLLPNSLSIKCSGGILGAGFAMVTVSTFGRSQSAAIMNGYNNDMDTYMFISSNLALLVKYFFIWVLFNDDSLC